MKKRLFRMLACLCSLAILLAATPLTVSAQDTDTVVDPVLSTDGGGADTDTTPVILGEMTSLREESVKHFRCEDGTMLAAIYEHPVHYRENGKWVDIDNTLVAETASDGTGYYRNKANSLQVRVPETLSASAPVTVTNGEHTLQWVMLDSTSRAATVSMPETAEQSVTYTGRLSADSSAQRVNKDLTRLENQHSAVTYSRVQDDVDVEYAIVSNRVKESIILQKYKKNAAFTFIIQSGALEARLQPDNSVHVFAEGETEPVFVIASPYMVDAMGEIGFDVAVTLTPVRGGYRYTLTPSDEWLAADERQYPVTLDPTVTVGETDGNIAAAQVYERYSTTNYGSVDLLYAGSSLIDGTTPREYRSYLKVTLPSMGGSHPVVVGATLTLTYHTEYNLHSSGGQINLYSATGSWTESSITWSNKPAAGTRVQDFIIGRKNADLNQNVPPTVTFDISALAAGWANGSVPNYGVVLQNNAVNTTAHDNVCWFSDESATASNRPTAEIYYRDVTGLEDYWTYTSATVGRGAGVAVNNATGMVTAVLPDAGVDGNRLPVSISHVYNTTNTSATAYGGKWRLNYQMSVVKDTTDTDGDGEADTPYSFTDGDGTTHFFRNAYVAIKDENGLGLEITEDTASTTARYTITDKSKTKMHFNSSGLLTSIVDENGNTVTVGYSGGQIASITDGAGRVYTLTYSNSQLASITDPAGRKTTYTYNSSGELAAVTYPDGVSTAIGYSGGLLTSLTGGGQKIALTYDGVSPQRVSTLRVHETATNTYLSDYAFDYKTNATDITDKTGDNNNTVTYQFNTFLQTVGVVDRTTGYAQSYKHGAPGGYTGKENKPLLVSNTQKSVQNYLKNHRLDSDFTANTGSFTVVKSSTGQTASVTYDSTRGHIGLGSIKVVRSAITATNPYVYAQQTYTVTTSGYYAVSAYATTNGATLTGPGAILRPERWTGSSVTGSAQSTTTYTPAGEWQRLYTTIYLEAGDTLKVLVGTNGGVTTGTMWFDDIQLERLTESVNTYNLLENSAFFNGTTGWVTHGTGTWTVTTDSSADRPVGADKVIKVPGNTKNRRFFCHTMTISNGKKGDVYSLGAWAKAASIYVDPDSTAVDTRAFRLNVAFYKNSVQVNARRVSFNAAYDGWQFLSAEAIAYGDYDRVDMSLEYSYNIGDALFALPYLYKDNYGQSYTYDTDGNVVAATDEEDVTTLAIYGDDRLAASVSPIGTATMLGYDSKGNLTSSMTTNGQLTTNAYDSYGNATSTAITPVDFVENPTTGTWYLLRNADTGNVLGVRHLQLTNPDTGAVVYDEKIVENTAWQGEANTAWQLEATAVENVYYLYSKPDWWVLTCSDPYAEEGTYFQTAILSYTPDQQFMLQDNGDGTFTFLSRASSQTKCVDGLAGSSLATDELDASNTTILHETYASDVRGQRWYFIDYDSVCNSATAIETSSTYTADGNYQASSTDALGNTTTYQTNTSTGNAEAVTTAAGVTTSYGYDTAGLHNTSVTVKKSDTTLASVGYVYDEDRLTGINVTNGTSYTLTYDSFGRSSATYVGSNVVADNALAQYIYNEEGLLDKLTYGNGQYVNYSYDPLGRQTKVWYNGNTTKTIETVYNGRGQVGLLKDPFANTRTRYEYDLAGRLVEARRTRGASADADSLWAKVSYRYEDGTGRLKETTVKSRVHTDTTGYVYGDATQGQMADAVYSVTQTGFTQLYYTYDSLGRIASRTLSYPNTTTYYTYSDGAEDNTTSTQIATITTDAGTNTYYYDDLGNLAAVYDGSNWTESYVYDSLGQIVNSYVDDGTNTYTSSYTYDDHGNILTATRNDAVSQQEVTHTYTYGDSVWKDKLTAYDGQAITYDAIDNPLTYRDGMTFTWQNGRQLATATVDGVTASYVYNADGGRYSKTVGGVTTEYYYVDGVLYAMTCGDDTLEFRYDDKGLPYVMVHNGNDYYYYEYNLQGDVVGLFNEGNSVQVTYTYNPYGDLLALTDTSTNGIGTLNPFRYRGYYYDHETGLYYCNSRYYDPETGRWINADGYVSTGQGISGHNMFTYCGNNPVNHTDSTGDMYERCAGAYGFAGSGGGGGGRVSIPAWNAPDCKFGLEVAIGVASTIAFIELQTEVMSIKKSASLSKAEEKTEAIPAPPKAESTTYYHATSLENATTIMATNTMVGGEYESKYIYAWRRKPSQYAIRNSGARNSEVIISFKTNASFVKDNGITNYNVQLYGPVVSVRPGPIAVWDVKIVG